MVFLLDLGVWDAIATDGPSVPYSADDADIDTCLDTASELLHDLTR